MVVRNSPLLYKWVLVCSFLMLSVLIGVLVFNTYRYKDKNFQNYQKQAIEKAYGHYIMNDKLFPGGNGIFGTQLEPYLPELVRLHEQDKVAFGAKRDTVLSSFWQELRNGNSMDTVFSQIVAQEGLDSSLQYSLQFDRLELLLPADGQWFVLYPSGEAEWPVPIAGNLAAPTENNRVLKLSVNAGHEAVYRFSYSLYVDYPNRFARVLQDMLPVFSFSIACILLLVFINYLTYRNWVDQRKEAQLKTEFLNHIRHEFNTPITTILICANSLKEQHSQLQAADVSSMGQIVERQAERLKLYFKQILDSVTIQEQQAQLELVGISGLTEELLQDISLRYADQIAIRIDPLSAERHVWVDPSLYFSILDNLVSNALKFNHRHLPAVDFQWNQEGNRLQLLVEDNGIGIEEKDQKLVFDQFYRSNQAGKTSGLGLGLYYVKTCVSRMDWDIAVGSSKSGGTIFTITINLEERSS
ncbi:sensor histidine kinase [Sphingobacterium hungaricum]|uniref:histidine kinase n=1 Tax=Sphingobacterium hungaricum TaxID=2082723 RepID=A0A928UVQ5_9SPHI|nr:HAMP domain-containing sensor histidine kinase [Sphingobacterium hungaricum]MBE8713828.1 hypothetical protein [Sphingobacterium hungaricum]